MMYMGFVTDSKLVAAVVIVTGIVCVGGIIVIVSLLAVRLWPSAELCCKQPARPSFHVLKISTCVYA